MDCAKVEVWNEQEARCGEAALLAESIGKAARSGMSIREFCRERRLKESQFYWWQRKLKGDGEERKMASGVGRRARFALVSDEAGVMATGLELVLRDGRRLRISQGVEEESLRAVLAALES